MKHKKTIVTILVIIVMLLMFVFLTSGRGQLSVILPESQNTQTSVSVYGADKEAIVSKSVDSQSYRITVKPGSYFVVIENSTGSYTKFVEVNGFMRTTKIDNFSLKDQLGREFVAERQKSCFSETSLGVFSYTCLGPLSSLILHEKATDSSPPKTISIETNSFNKNRIIEAVHETEDGVFVMTYEAGRDNLHDVFKLNRNQNIVSTTLVDTVSLSSQPLQQRGTSYSKNPVTLANSTAVYGGDNLRKLQKLASPLDFGPNTISIGQFSDNSWVALEEESASSNPPVINYTVRLVDKNKSMKTERPSDFVVCADYLFILDVNSNLSIFSANLNPEKELFGISDLLCVDDKPHIVLDNKLFILSVEDSRFEGFIAVNSPTLSITGVEQYNDNAFVVAGFVDKKVLVKLSDSAKKIDAILNGFTSSKYVSSLSLAGSTVFVSLELGQLVVDPITGDYDYDQNTLTLAEKEIQTLIAEVKSIDPSIEFIVPLLD